MATYWVLDPEIHGSWADAHQVEAPSPQRAAGSHDLQVWDVLFEEARAGNSPRAEVYVSDRPDGSGSVWAFRLGAQLRYRVDVDEIEPSQTFPAREPER